MLDKYLSAISEALETQVKRDVAYAVSARENEIRELLGLEVMIVDITTDNDIYENVEIWCSHKYRGCTDYHMDTLVAGNKHGDLVFLRGFKKIETLL